MDLHPAVVVATQKPHQLAIKHGLSEHFLAYARLQRFNSVDCVELRSKWPYTEWETGPTQKSRENGKENGKWPQARNGQKMAAEMEKWPKKGQNPILGPIFPFRLAIFWPFRAWGHFPFSFPFSRDFCVGPVSHSVYGHFDRKCRGIAATFIVLSLRR